MRDNGSDLGIRVQGLGVGVQGSRRKTSTIGRPDGASKQLTRSLSRDSSWELGYGERRCGFNKKHQSTKAPKHQSTKAPKHQSSASASGGYQVVRDVAVSAGGEGILDSVEHVLVARPEPGRHLIEEGTTFPSQEGKT